MEAASWLVDVAFLMGGYAGGAIAVGRSGPRPRKVGAARKAWGKLVQNLRRLGDRPGDPVAEARVARAREAYRTAAKAELVERRSDLWEQLGDAASQSTSHVEAWLSRQRSGASQGMPAQMEDSTGRLLSTEETRAALLAFRKEVAAVEPHFDDAALQRLEDWDAEEHRRVEKAYRNREWTPPPLPEVEQLRTECGDRWAPGGVEEADSTEDETGEAGAPEGDAHAGNMWVSAALIRWATARLRSGVTSLGFPLGALKALSREEGVARMLAALIGLEVGAQRAPARCGTRAVTHVHKGKGRTILRFESYRPIGVGHAVSRLADEIWDYRNGPLVRRFAGVAQLAGRMGALEAALAHLTRVELRLQVGLPTAVVYSDVRYGFDGGRHALISRKVAEARAPDWAWTRHMLATDRMSVVHGGERVPDFSTDGVGAGQGKRQSPDLFAAAATLARDRVAAVAEGAGVSHPQWALSAFAESGWRGRADMITPRSAWAADLALRVLGGAQKAAGEEDRKALAVAAFAQCSSSGEAAVLLEALDPGFAPIAQCLDDNALLAATASGAARVWRALCASGDEAGFVYKCGRGKSEFQFFGFPVVMRAALDAYWDHGQGGQHIGSCRVHDYVGVRFDDDLSWEPHFKMLAARGRGVLGTALREHAPGSLPGAAKILLVRRCEASALWGAEFCIDEASWPRRAAEFNRLQVDWWRRVFEVTDPSASWYRILVEGGEADRASAKVLVRAIALVNRVALFHEDELARGLFDRAWSSRGPSWIAGMRRRMEALGIGLARDAEGLAAPTTRAAKRTFLQAHLRDVVWPAVRSAGAAEWWDSRTLGADHQLFNTFEPSATGIQAMLDDLRGGSPKEGVAAWHAVAAWIQLRVLGALNPSRFNGEPLPCALCTSHGVRDALPETARHLLWDCEWGERLSDRADEVGGWGAVERRWLGGAMGEAELLRAVKAVGRLAARVWRARPEAARVLQDAQLQEWLLASGLAPLLQREQ